MNMELDLIRGVYSGFLSFSLFLFFFFFLSSLSVKVFVNENLVAQVWRTAQRMPPHRFHISVLKRFSYLDVLNCCRGGSFFQSAVLSTQGGLAVFLYGTVDLTITIRNLWIRAESTLWI